MKKSLLSLTLLCLSLPAASQPNTSALDGLTIGVLASLDANAYATDDKVGVLPLVLYDNDHFYAEGSEFGFYAHKDSKNWFRVGVGHESRHFKPDDATKVALKNLNPRQSSANLVLSYTSITPIGGFEMKAGLDMMDRSGGQMLSLAHRSLFKFADDKLTIYPKFGINWYSDDYNQYYFGVSEQESIKTGMNVHTVKSSYSPFVMVSGKYRFGDHVGAVASTKAQWLSSTQKNSPLTDGKMDIKANMGLTYTF